MSLQIDPPEIYFVLPEGFDAAALLPDGMKHYADQVNFLMDQVYQTRGTPMDFDFINRVTGGQEVTDYLFAVLVDNGYLRPVYPTQETEHAEAEYTQETKTARPRSSRVFHRSRRHRPL